MDNFLPFMGTNLAISDYIVSLGINTFVRFLADAFKMIAFIGVNI